MTKKTVKPHGRTIYGFNNLGVKGYFITDKSRNNVMTALRNYNKKYNPISCDFTTYTDGTTKVTRTS